jgi:hypothetical protein
MEIAAEAWKEVVVELPFPYGHSILVLQLIVQSPRPLDIEEFW